MGVGCIADEDAARCSPRPCNMAGPRSCPMRLQPTTSIADPARSTCKWSRAVSGRCPGSGLVDSALVIVSPGCLLGLFSGDPDILIPHDLKGYIPMREPMRRNFRTQAAGQCGGRGGCDKFTERSAAFQRLLSRASRARDLAWLGSGDCSIARISSSGSTLAKIFAPRGPSHLMSKICPQ